MMCIVCLVELWIIVIFLVCCFNEVCEVSEYILGFLLVCLICF